MKNKECFKCKIIKPLQDFYKHKRMKDGYVNKCKECNKKDVRKNYSLRRQQYSQYDFDRNLNIERRRKKGIYQKNHRLKNPDKAFARRILGNYVRDGKIIKQPCEACKSIKSQAHHDDYSKPLEVKWLCFKCHRELEHNQVVTKNT